MQASLECNAWEMNALSPTLALLAKLKQLETQELKSVGVLGNRAASSAVVTGWCRPSGASSLEGRGSPKVAAEALTEKGPASKYELRFDR